MKIAIEEVWQSRQKLSFKTAYKKIESAAQAVSASAASLLNRPERSADGLSDQSVSQTENAAKSQGALSPGNPS